MKKIILFIVTTFLVLPFTVNASTDITNLSASYSNNSVTITGDTSDSILAVAVILYDSTGTSILRMVTDSVSNDSFSTKIDSINLEAGSTYIVKVANYDGGNYYETSFKVADKTTTTTTIEDNPQTSDEIMGSILLGSISLIGLIGSGLYIKKKRFN